MQFLSGPHAVHLRCLHLGAAYSWLRPKNADNRTETVALQMACLTACSRLPLRELRLWSHIKQPSLGYLASLTSLHRLALSTGEGLQDLELPEGRRAFHLHFLTHS